MSRRMGQDKVFLKYSGGAFLECIYKNALICFDNIFISTDNKEHAKAIKALPGLKDLKEENIILDRYPRCGPIGGICSVFDETQIDKFAIIPTDVPDADMHVLEILFDLCKDRPCIYRLENGELEKLIGAYHRKCYDAFKSKLEAKRFSIIGALEGSGYDSYSKTELINIDPELSETDFDRAFKNINRPEDYRILLNEQ